MNGGGGGKRWLLVLWLVTGARGSANPNQAPTVHTKSYDDHHPGFMLRNHLIDNREDYDRANCGLWCMYTGACRSFQLTADGVCELNSSDRNINPEDLVEQAGSVYWGMLPDTRPTCVLNRAHIPINNEGADGQACGIYEKRFDGQWSPYSEWTGWERVNAYQYAKVRKRQCVGPFHGGEPCVGDATETELCDTFHWSASSDTFANARQACEDMGGWLIEPRNRKEMNWFNRYNDWDGIWTGWNDTLENNVFRSQDGQRTLPHTSDAWKANEPADSPSSCVIIAPRVAGDIWKRNDLIQYQGDCGTATFKYICQFHLCAPSAR